MNKIKYIVPILLCVCINSWGQVVSQTEYFWDTDPGEGNGIVLNATDGSFNANIESFSSSTIAVPATTGLHVFNVRSKDSNNQWGPLNKQVVYVNPAALGASAVPTLAQVEYFWDTDPGQGNGLPFTATDGDFSSTVEKFVKTDINIVNPIGLHVLNVRAKDNTGAWGPVNKQVILIEAVLSINPNTIADSYYFSPNPGTTVIRFNKDIESVIIVDLNGRQMATSTLNNEVNIEGLASGTYILKVTTPEGLTFNKKMIKR
jgi:Secretion system C-terminal sorting domain